MAKGLDKAVPKTKYTEDSFELGHTQVTCWARVTINVPLAAGYALRPLISYGLSAQVWGSYAKLDVETGEVVWGYGCCQCTTRATPGGPACFAKRSTMFLGDATNISLADAAPAGLLKNKGEWIGGRADGETAELVARPHPASPCITFLPPHRGDPEWQVGFVWQFAHGACGGLAVATRAIATRGQGFAIATRGCCVDAAATDTQRADDANGGG